MGLPYGCSKKADELFAKRHTTQMGTVVVHQNPLNTAILTIDGVVNTHMNLTYLRGDCTACTAYLEYLKIDELPKMFTAIQEYMSINGRISCFFSLKKSKDSLKDWIDQIKKFPVAGLHVQKSNREPDSDYYMLTGILKVPSPIINSYARYNEEYPKNHNNNDVTYINALNKELGLQTF